MGSKSLLKTALFIGALTIPVASFADTFKEAVKDSAITVKVKADFAKDKQVSALHIKVDTDANGMVQLSGNAKTQGEADKAVSIAKSVKGVTSVDNEIVVGAK